MLVFGVVVFKIFTPLSCKHSSSSELIDGDETDESDSDEDDDDDGDDDPHN
jgi:hypothetical protein